MFHGTWSVSDWSSFDQGSFISRYVLRASLIRRVLSHIALTINTLGIAMDASMFAFVADFVDERLSARSFMLLASLEGLGSLIGIAILYPIYQWGLEKEGYLEGAAYYICSVSVNLASRFVYIIADFFADIVCYRRGPHLEVEAICDNNGGSIRPTRWQSQDRLSMRGALPCSQGSIAI